VEASWPRLRVAEALWRPCRTRSAGAEHASLLRARPLGSGTDLRRLNFPRSTAHHVASDRLRRREILLRRAVTPLGAVWFTYLMLVTFLLTMTLL